ncbi:hypothetical protein PHET_00883 [Paragonimus heterotremus]|uniref:EF-hand domain-containing protein n=1 Tax=Paragonimus heterotremus TaxID=100268 RepID=A0A8J4WLP8_9TREM|nr:hypothetical protein PHET_00883 [Paragonimus heterotremus]
MGADRRVACLGRFLKKVERENARLLCERDEYLNDPSKIRRLLQRFATWYREHIIAFESALSSFPSNISRITLAEIFKDMDVPWNTTESYVLFSYLDQSGSGVLNADMLLKLFDLTQQASTPLLPHPPEDIGNLPAVLDENDLLVCARSVTSLASGSPLNLELTINKNATIQQLSHRIIQMLDLPANKLIVKEKKHSDSPMDPSAKLESFTATGQLDVFYDYPVGFIDCPVLSSDAYFIWRTVDRML